MEATARAASRRILRTVTDARNHISCCVGTRAREVCLPFLTHVRRISNNYPHVAFSRDNADAVTRGKIATCSSRETADGVRFVLVVRGLLPVTLLK